MMKLRQMLRLKLVIKSDLFEFHAIGSTVISIEEIVERMKFFEKH